MPGLFMYTARGAGRVLPAAWLAQPGELLREGEPLKVDAMCGFRGHMEVKVHVRSATATTDRHRAARTKACATSPRPGRGAARKPGPGPRPSPLSGGRERIPDAGAS